MKDPIVEEVRRHRMSIYRVIPAVISAAICHDLRSAQKASRRKAVRLPKRLACN